MNVGALIVTTGLPGTSGIAALHRTVGSSTAGARLLAVMQKAGVGLIGLVTGPEQKALEREFVQDNVIFLRCESEQVDFYEGVRHGLDFMADKLDQIFLLPGDLSLVLPSTLEVLLQTPGELLVPVHRCIHGYPVLLGEQAIQAIRSSPGDSLEEALTNCGLDVSYVPVEDPGVLLRSADMTHRGDLIAMQDRQLRRAVVEVSLAGADPFYDKRLSMLLHLIQDNQSVRLACSLMQMSYSTAWNLLNHAEDALGFPLVRRNRGGNSGSGSLLTPKGLALMTGYDRFLAQLEQTAKELYRDLFQDIE